MATEIVTKKDYQKIERLGLLPTDRDPSAWLRMVARVFAAYKQVSLDKSIVAYIDGFWILNQDYIDGNDIKFVIQKGTCFIDDQFIGFTDDILFKYPKVNLLPGNKYFLVLYYQWAYEFDYNLAEFKIIEPDLFDDQTMLRIASFEYTSAGQINLFPQDLDDQYASNFKKLFEIAKDKIIDSIETMKYHYEVFDPNDHKIDPTVKSGDYVYLDYIDGKYKPARACTKEFDKAVGLYLKNNNNNKDYVIYEGIVDFSDPKWGIDKERIYLKNLEPGSSYYLADGCTDSEVIQSAEYYRQQERGKISTYFFPGTVRVGYALDINKLFVKIDYTADLTIQNFIELFGDSPRFWQIYQDFYKYYGYQGQLKYLIEKANENNALIETLSNISKQLDNDIASLNSDLQAEKNDLNKKESDLNTLINTSITTFKNEIKNIIDYSNTNKFQQYNLANIFSLESIQIAKEIIESIKNQVKAYSDDLNKKRQANTGEYASMFSKSSYTVESNGCDNFINYLTNLSNYLNDIEILFVGSSDNKIKYITDSNSPVQINPLLKIIKDIKDNANSNNPADLKKDIIATNLKTLYDDSNSTIKGYFYKALQKIKTNKNNLENNYFTILKNQDIHRSYNFTIQLSNISYNDYSLTLSKNNCLQSDSDLSKISTSLTFNQHQDSSKIEDKYYDYLNELTQIQLYIEKAYFYINKVINFSILKIKKLLDELNKYNYNFSTIQNNINNSITNVDTKNADLKTKYLNYLTSLNNYLKTKESYNYKNYAKAYINHLLSQESQGNNELIQQKTDIQNKITNMNNLLPDELGDTLFTPSKNIFTLSNYQRKVYNYTYLTQRIKIKQFELKKVNDDIEIINNEIIKVQTTVPIDQGLLEKLNNIKGAFETVKSEINNELDSMVAEYNRLRTEFFGLDPISKDDVNFDPGPYFIKDLECLELKE